MKTNQLIPIIILLITHESIAQIASDSFGTFKFDVNSTKTTNVFKHKTTGLVYFKADYDLDADGSPRAYNPQNTGIEANGNGSNSKGEFSPNVILFKNNKPHLQTQTDPFPGFFVSLTTLNLQNFLDTSVKRYVNSEEIPYFVLPSGSFKKMGVDLGDIGIVFNTLTKKSTFAIFADTGPSNIIGEGSIALAKKIGITAMINKKGKIVGGNDNGDILYIVFPHSGKGEKSYKDLTIKDVDNLGQKAVEKFGDSQALITMILGLMK